MADHTMRITLSFVDDGQTNICNKRKYVNTLGWQLQSPNQDHTSVYSPTTDTLSLDGIPILKKAKLKAADLAQLNNYDSYSFQHMWYGPIVGSHSLPKAAPSQFFDSGIRTSGSPDCSGSRLSSTTDSWHASDSSDFSQTQDSQSTRSTSTSDYPLSHSVKHLC